MNTKTVKSILLIVSFIFAQMGAVYAEDASSCPMMESMSENMTTESHIPDGHQAVDDAFADCCNEIMMPENEDCCDTTCKCALSFVSFGSLPNFNTIATHIQNLNLVRMRVNQPSDIFLTQAQRPPIPFIS